MIGVAVCALGAAVLGVLLLLRPTALPPGTVLVPLILGGLAGAAARVSEETVAPVLVGATLSVAFVPVAPILAAANVLGWLVHGERQVTAEEGEGTESEVLEMLGAGRLRGFDTVWMNGAWQSLDESPQFYEACLEAERRRRPARVAAYAGCLVLGFLLFAGVLFVVLSIPKWVADAGN